MQHYNFEMTAKINAVVGNVAAPTDIKGLLKQIELIDHEVDEGDENQPILATDINAVRDDVCDILFTTYGLAARLGYLPEQIDLAAFAGTTASSNFEAVKKAVGEFNGNLPEKANELLRSMKETLGIIEVKITDDDLDALEPEERGNQIQLAVLIDVHLLLNDAYTLGAICGYPVDEDYREVVRANLSKFDTSLVDAMNTKAKYKLIDIETVYLETTITTPDGKTEPCFVTKSAVDQVDAKGNRYPQGKWLKSVNWKDVEYAPL